MSLALFDLDGTLAESKSPIDPEMTVLLTSLLETVQVAVISGGDWPQFQQQLLVNLPPQSRLTNLSILPTTGTKFFRYVSDWEKLYSEDLSDDEKEKIVGALNQAMQSSDSVNARIWGQQIEDRGTQITLSALGQQAPLEAKKQWDPDFAKRKAMQTRLESLIPEFNVRLGGTTSVDVTKHGIDKAYGINKLRDILGIAIEEMIFVGDALFPGGNDYPAKEAGVVSIQVRDPDESKRVIEAILACMGAVRHG